MSIYRYSASSPVSEASFRYANDRPPVALLSAGEGASAEQIAAIRHSLRSNKWNAVPTTVNGKEYLQVSGFEKEEHLINYLQSLAFTTGEAERTAEAGDHPKRTAQQLIQDSSLRIAGGLNLIGDAALLASGVMSGNKYDLTGGALYTAGAAVAARYGNVKTAHHLREVQERTAKALKKEVGDLPQDCGLHQVWKDMDQGVIANTEDFFYRYPSEVMLGTYTMGAIAMLMSGIQQKNSAGIAYGVNSVAMKAASLMIPEKQITAEQKAAHKGQPIAQFVDWVQEKPMRLMGYGSMISDILLGLSAMKEYRSNPKQKSYIFKFITTGTYILADFMMAISNKGHGADGKFDADEQRQIISLAAESIARQPKDMQAALANQLAGYLATQPEIRGKARDVGKEIIEQVEHMERNPWACRAQVSRSDPSQGKDML